MPAFILVRESENRPTSHRVSRAPLEIVVWVWFRGWLTAGCAFVGNSAAFLGQHALAACGLGQGAHPRSHPQLEVIQPAVTDSSIPEAPRC